MVRGHGAGHNLFISTVSETPIDKSRSSFRGQSLTPSDPAQAIADLGQCFVFRKQAEPADWKRPDLLLRHYDGSMPNEHLETLFDELSAARQRGARIAFDPNYRIRISV